MTGLDPLPGIQISGREVYDQLVRLTDAVVELNGKMNRVIDQQADVREEVRDHEGRVRMLERSRWPLPSLAILFAAGSLVVALLPMLSKS